MHLKNDERNLWIDPLAAVDALVFAGIFAGILEGAEDAGGAEGG